MSVWNDFIARYTSGSRESPAIDLSSVGVALSSEISWEATVPEDTTLIVEIALSLDGGETWGEWQACTSGQSIPEINQGSDLSNVQIKIRESFTTADTTKTAQLQSLQINIPTGYKEAGALTSIVIDSSLANIEFTVSTPSNTSITVEYREQEGSSWSNWVAVQNNRVIGGKDKIQYRVLFSTDDIGVTPVLSEVKLTPIKYFAVSPSIDTSKAQDINSGKVTYDANFAGTAAAEIRTRTSADGISWSAWEPIDASGNIASIHQNYAQVLIIPSGDNGPNNVTFGSLSLSYDGTPMAEELATGFTPGGQFYFATMLNTLIITNMLDPPKKWNGTDAVEELGGTPPHAQYIATHRNYVFMARTVSNPNRLYFSEVLNFDNWPALNFIDISPNDGDWITGLMPYDDYLIIAKNRSMWILVGTGPSDFEVRRIHDGVGCVAPRSLTKMAQTFVFASSEGLYMSDLSQEVLLSERLKETWRGLNQRRLNQIAAIYYDHKLRVDVPNGSSTKNNLRIVYDTIQKALSLEEFTDHASCYTKFTEAGQEILLYGHATEGQVSRADFGTTDNGEPITMYWGTKYFNFGSSAIEKKVRYLYLVVIPAMSDTQLDIYLVVNGVQHSTPLSVVVPGDALGVARTLKLDPRKLGIRKVKSIGYDIIQRSTNGGVKFHELLQEYMIKKIRETA